jgi:hypothetical protein
MPIAREKTLSWTDNLIIEYFFFFAPSHACIFAVNAYLLPKYPENYQKVICGVTEELQSSYRAVIGQ